MSVLPILRACTMRHVGTILYCLDLVAVKAEFANAKKSSSRGRQRRLVWIFVSCQTNSYECFAVGHTLLVFISISLSIDAQCKGDRNATSDTVAIGRSQSMRVEYSSAVL
jgi:hypothetical protein